MPNLCIFPSRALEDPTITDADLRVLAAIGIYTDREGSNCFANARTLWTRARVGRSTFFDATRRLVAGGYIERVSGQLKGRSSFYSVILDSRRVSGQPDSQVSSQPDSGVRPGPDSPTMNAPINDSSSSNGLTPEKLDDSGLPFLADGYGPDLDELELRITKAGGSITAWRNEMRRALDEASPLQVSSAIRYFAANGADLNLRLFMGYVRSVVAGGGESAPESTAAVKKRVLQAHTPEEPEKPALPFSEGLELFKSAFAESQTHHQENV